MKVRTRFAPSPTGFMHVGGVRTALFAWLVAKQANGQFVLRIEDTDQARGVKDSVEHIMESLAWLDIVWDEGPDRPGKYGPYKQSERLDIYKSWAQKLIDKGRAYADPYTPEELQAFRDEAKSQKRPFLFRNHRPSQMLRTTSHPDNWYGKVPLRFKSEPKPYRWHDAVMGDLSAGAEAVDDFIIMKSDGFPTYNFAHIVDDYEMQLTHVIRSQEFIASVPRFLNLYEALEIEPPILATLPFVLGPDGNKKLSKRDGAKDILAYREEGYLPGAMLNFLATLGWNDGTEQEEFSVEELVEKFSLGRVQKSGARFDPQRLIWLNGAHIRKIPLDELYTILTNRVGKDFWPPEAKKFPEAYKKQVLGLVQERMKFFAELPELTMFFFKDLPLNPELISGHKQLKKLKKDDLQTLLQATQTELEQSDFSTQDLTNRLNALLVLTHTKPAVLFSLIRIATTQAPASPGLADTLAVLGKQTSLRRLKSALKSL